MLGSMMGAERSVAHQIKSPLVNTALVSEVLCYPQLPLAVYREMAAHLQQVSGVTATLMPPNFDQFDYYQSQVGGLQLQYNDDLPPLDCQRVEEIIHFYAQRYGAPERRPTPVSSYSI